MHKSSMLQSIDGFCRMKDLNMATHRVQMDMPKASFERLKALKEKQDAASYTEIMKDAIRLYEYFVQKDEEGAKFFVEKDGKMSEVLLFMGP